MTDLANGRRVSEELIRMAGVTYGFPEGPQVFSDYDWVVDRGETWAVLGPSGCGKTTLLYLLAGLVRPDRGMVAVGGKEILRPRPRTGLIIQEYGLLPWATVRENARLGLRIRSFYGPDGTHAPREQVSDLEVDPWLERLDLAAQAEKYPGQLSGGQRQRTAIARTLVLAPDILLMDEPFSSLDAPTRAGLQDLTLELQEEGGLTLVLVTHSIEEAAYLGKNILLLGHPPNREPEIISNPGASRPGFRGSTDFQAVCTQLRQRMEGEVVGG